MAGQAPALLPRGLVGHNRLNCLALSQDVCEGDARSGTLCFQSMKPVIWNTIERGWVPVSRGWRRMRCCGGTDIYVHDLFGFAPAFDMAEVSREKNAGCGGLKANLAIVGKVLQKYVYSRQS